MPYPVHFLLILRIYITKTSLQKHCMFYIIGIFYCLTGYIIKTAAIYLLTRDLYQEVCKITLKQYHWQSKTFLHKNLIANCFTSQFRLFVRHRDIYRNFSPECLSIHIIYMTRGLFNERDLTWIQVALPLPVLLSGGFLADRMAFFYAL